MSDIQFWPGSVILRGRDLRARPIAKERQLNNFPFFLRDAHPTTVIPSVSYLIVIPKSLAKILSVGYQKR